MLSSYQRGQPYSTGWRGQHVEARTTAHDEGRKTDEKADEKSGVAVAFG